MEKCKEMKQNFPFDFFAIKNCCLIMCESCVYQTNKQKMKFKYKNFPMISMIENANVLGKFIICVW